MSQTNRATRKASFTRQKNQHLSFGVFAEDGLPSGLGQSQVWKLGQQKLEEIRWARNTRECVYVLAPVCMTAENLLRIFPKGSELKKNTNFTLAHDLTGLERGSRSQSWMTERSLFKPSPSSPIFSGLFSFPAVPAPQR